MGRIRVLPDALANKIAAGEVVERPSSVAKELLENAIDAGAARIQIAFEAGGRRLIQVADDGEGMNRDDAITAFERHATSKLRQIEDLELIHTLGFRGEALPSIAAVSRLRLRTKAAGDTVGTEVEFVGGKLVAVRDIAWPGGTEIEVKDIFFNVPARRKFLKGESTESYHITNLVQHYALANPKISFLLIKEGREVINASQTLSVRERAYQLLGSELLSKLVEVDYQVGRMKVFGLVSNPQEQRSSRDTQYLFVNGRFVRDRLIWRALSEAYRSMMPSGMHPAAVLFLDLPPDEVDVNVHPAKTEVRFLNEAALLSGVKQAVAQALSFAQPVTKLPDPMRSYGSARPAAAEPVRDFSLIIPEPEEDFSTKKLDLRFEGRVTGVAARSSASEQTLPEVVELEQTIAAAARMDRPDIAEEVLPGLGHGMKPLGQIRDSYVVATDEEGLVLIDQHVAHERILFERFRDHRLAGRPESQTFLIPQTIDLSPSEAEAFEVVAKELEDAGFETMQLSGRTIAIKAAPAGVGSGQALEVVREVLAVAERSHREFSIEHAREEIAASLACKAAIKVNMPLTQEKMQWLIDELMKTQNPMTCPHGRPIIMRFELRDIERGFKRPV